MMKIGLTTVILALLWIGPAYPQNSYEIVETEQESCFNNTSQITCPTWGEPFYGQDAQYMGHVQSYIDNGDGTVTDLTTGLMWQQTPGEKVTYSVATSAADTFSLGGYDDWRFPNIKELYSLIDFRGIDPSGWMGTDTTQLTPFINTDYFDFTYGDINSGERIIDAQYWSSTQYVGTVFNGQIAIFGVNFADGRIKGYPRDIGMDGGPMTQFVRYVRGNPDYGINDFVDNGDGTVTDSATGLMWMQGDSEAGMIWQDALDYAENLEYAGYNDWRLPNAKELESIIDYTRSPSTTGTAAIDPIFDASPITDEGGGTDYPFYWTSTTHESMGGVTGGFAAYVCFGTAYGFMESPPGSGNYQLMDVHGAGAQRSDPKNGDPSDYPYGHGPQGDVVRIYNYVRCVRDVTLTTSSCGDADGSGNVDIDDVIYLIGYVFSGGPAPDPVSDGDADCSGAVDIDDVVYLIAYIFTAGTPPCEPDGIPC